VSAGQHLQRGGLLRVARHRPVVVPIGSHQVREHLGVARIRFGSRGHVAFAVATGCQRVDRIDLVAGGQQRSHQQPPVGLDPNDDLVGLRRVLGQQRVKLTHALEAFRNPSLGQDRAYLVQHADVVVRLRPINADEDFQPAPPSHR